ncbi:MAG: carbonic anhydrase [Bacteriovoracaceae bacterium]
MEKINRLILENKAWAQGKTEIDPQYFANMANDQNPDYLWIGCADSRVPPSEITNTDPGEMFVHRNIANLVVHTDMNLLSVLSYAVEHLKVRHIIVCGHYNCGGVKAAMSPKSLGMLNNWVRNIKDIYSVHKKDLDLIKSPVDQVNRLVELNVLEQIRNLAHTSIIQKAWLDLKQPYIHGMIYDLTTGILKNLETIGPEYKIDEAHRYEF